MLDLNGKVDGIVNQSPDVQLQEIQLGKFKLSYTPAGILVISVGDEWMMMSSIEATRVLAFLQAYSDSFIRR